MLSVDEWEMLTNGSSHRQLPTWGTKDSSKMTVAILNGRQEKVAKGSDDLFAQKSPTAADRTLINLPPTPTHPTRPIPPSPPSTCSNPGAPATIFRYERLHGATDEFSPSNVLGEGGHGSMYRGTLSDGRTIAIKRLYESSCRRAELFWNEVDILGSLRHPNLLTLYRCTTRHSRELLLVYEFIPNGTIADHLHEHHTAEGALAWPLHLPIAMKTTTALAHLHAVQPPILMAMDSQTPTMRCHCNPPPTRPFSTATAVPSALAPHRHVLCSSSWQRVASGALSTEAPRSRGSSSRGRALSGSTSRRVWVPGEAGSAAQPHAGRASGAVCCRPRQSSSDAAPHYALSLQAPTGASFPHARAPGDRAQTNREQELHWRSPISILAPNSNSLKITYFRRGKTDHRLQNQHRSLDRLTSKVAVEVVAHVPSGIGAAVPIVDPDEGPERTRLDLALVLQHLVRLHHRHGELPEGVPPDVSVPQEPIPAFPPPTAAAVTAAFFSIARTHGTPAQRQQFHQGRSEHPTSLNDV
ncbi:hypothetical protein Taro_035103 [Colocasia esculenta]|uniref:Protein kinase domain-containing protein n=1 Tax=Colocasia esculenta TaxID=4460 RepID=A0A843W4S6_COLES|nr:hypothetical protein [Colocasia esculenta]